MSHRTSKTKGRKSSKKISKKVNRKSKRLSGGARSTGRRSSKKSSKHKSRKVRRSQKGGSLSCAMNERDSIFKMINKLNLFGALFIPNDLRADINKNVACVSLAFRNQVTPIDIEEIINTSISAPNNLDYKIALEAVPREELITNYNIMAAAINSKSTKNIPINRAISNAIFMMNTIKKPYILKSNNVYYDGWVIREMYHKK